MSSRRDFLTGFISAGIGAAIGFFLGRSRNGNEKTEKPTPVKGERYKGGLLISTWNHGIPANAQGWAALENGGDAVDAVEQGVRIVEEDPTGTSVGIGGKPDREGIVTLDACIMNREGNAGSVSFLEDILHPISVARKVMEETPHVMLAGSGARQYALEQGFETTNLLTPESEAAYKEWLETAEYKPIINVENHDTIGMIGMDFNGDMAGACTTSGLGYKMRGRVGDSPVIGAGLFVDNEVGAATATGLGEEVLRTCGSFLIVELMRQGATPQEACEEGIARIIANHPDDFSDFQIGYLAFNTTGEVGAYAVHPGFQYAIHKNGENELVDVDSYAS